MARPDLSTEPNGQRRPRMQAISCPWHGASLEHPNGSPECGVVPGNVAAGRVIHLPSLIAWLALLLDEVARTQVGLLKSLVDAGVVAIDETELSEAIVEAEGIIVEGDTDAG